MYGDQPRLPQGLTGIELSQISRLLGGDYGQQGLTQVLTTLEDWRSFLGTMSKFQSEGLDLYSYLDEGRRLLTDSANGVTGIGGIGVSQPWGTWYDLESWGPEFNRSPYSASTTDTIEAGSVIDANGESPRVGGDALCERNGVSMVAPVGLPMMMSDEEIGTQELGRTAFVIVAGGLGERLGFTDIKVKLQMEQTTCTTYIEFFLRWLLAIPDAVVRPPFLVIMTSDDTHARTLDSLAQLTDGDFHESVLDHFRKLGMEPKPHLREGKRFSAANIRIVKQSAVPCFADSKGLISVQKRDHAVTVDTKPHGHGDIHSLIFKHGLCTEMQQLGLRHILFWQDTNALFVHAAACLIGHAMRHKLVMNFLAIPRVPQEALGALCLISKGDDKYIYQSVEYNMLGALLQPHGGEVGQLRPAYNTPTAYSIYPGNTNIFVINVDVYVKVLEKSKGKVPDFVNPKYSDGTKTKFTSPARLECMMQDISILISELNTGPYESWKYRIGYLELPRWHCFSPIKNNMEAAALKFANKIPTESAASAEFDLYLSNLRLIEMALTAFSAQVRLVKHQSVTSSPTVNTARKRLDSADSKDADWNSSDIEKGGNYIYSFSSFGILDHFSVKVDNILVPYFARVILDPAFAYDTYSLTKRFSNDIEFIIQYGSTLHISGDVQFEQNAKVHVSGYVSLVAKPGGKIIVKNLITADPNYYWPAETGSTDSIRGYAWKCQQASEPVIGTDRNFRKFLELPPYDASHPADGPVIISTDKTLVIDHRN